MHTQARTQTTTRTFPISGKDTRTQVLRIQGRKCVCVYMHTHTHTHVQNAYVKPSHTFLGHGGRKVHSGRLVSFKRANWCVCVCIHLDVCVRLHVNVYVCAYRRKHNKLCIRVESRFSALKRPKSSVRMLFIRMAVYVLVCVHACSVLCLSLHFVHRTCVCVRARAFDM